METKVVNMEAETYLEDPPEVEGHKVGTLGCGEREVITKKLKQSPVWTSGGW